MDVAESSAKSLRAKITEKYHERVDETRTKNGEAPRPPINTEDVEEEVLTGTIEAPKQPVPRLQRSQAEIPLLSLRELMPEGAQNTDQDDRSLDHKFKADKIEFVLVSRDATPSEIQHNAVLEDVQGVNWGIPSAEEYFEVIGKVTSAYTDVDPSFIHGLSWSSVGSQTGTGVFTIKTGVMEHIVGFRGMLRDLVNKGHCYESIPKQAILNKYSLTLFISPGVAFVDTKKVLGWLLELNRGLKGKIEPVSVKKFKESHPVVKRRGARIVSFTGDQAFLDSLYQFPRDYPFDVKVGNIYIRGGDRTEQSCPKYSRNKPRPRMTQAALHELLSKNRGDIADQAMEAEDRLAGLKIGSGSRPT
jgi:hypothetical protein